MSKIVKIGAVLATSMILSLSGSAFADEAADLFKAKTCNTCHGDDGNAPTAPIYPKVAGQSVEYTTQQIKDIRDGKRTNGQTAVMKAILTANPVSDEEVDKIAKWLSEQGK